MRRWLLGVDDAVSSDFPVFKGGCAARASRVLAELKGKSVFDWTRA
jgi:hypothetical protein